MKTLKISFTIVLGLWFALSSTSCFLVVTKDSGKHNNGKQKGWYKNPNNSYHPLIIKVDKPNKKHKH